MFAISINTYISHLTSWLLNKWINIFFRYCKNTLMLAFQSNQSSRFFPFLFISWVKTKKLSFSQFLVKNCPHKWMYANTKLRYFILDSNCCKEILFYQKTFPWWFIFERIMKCINHVFLKFKNICDCKLNLIKQT